MTRVAILNSRQSKTPVGKDRWVRATLAAVEHVAQNGWAIVSSYGLSTWELVTWAAGQREVPLALVVPEDTTDDQRSDILRRFELRGELVEWIAVARDDGRSRAKNWWEGRDAAIVSSAELLLPIRIRKGGRLEGLLAVRESASIDDRFRIPHVSSAHHIRFDITPDSVDAELRTWDNGWLIHWTRACSGPWPGETEAEYYTALSKSGDEYCHTGVHALQRILQEKRLRASSWRIGSGVPVIAFTELSPIESIALMRWRPRWSRWSIEPYGIAIRRELAESLGLRPVRYIDNQEWESLTVEEKPFSHTRGKKADIWPAEREWRVAGDIDLRTIPIDQVRVITRCQFERDAIAIMCEHRVMCFEERSTFLP